MSKENMPRNAPRGRGHMYIRGGAAMAGGMAWLAMLALLKKAFIGEGNDTFQTAVEAAACLGVVLVIAGALTITWARLTRNWKEIRREVFRRDREQGNLLSESQAAAQMEE